MRSDYALYTVAVIFFILTAIAAVALSEAERSLWAITTAVLGLLFIGLGYSQRSKSEAFEVPPPLVRGVPETVSDEETETVMETAPTAALTGIRGIGEKRAEQLRSLGIDNVEDLAEASAESLAAELKISAKVTGRWIEDAKKLAEKP